MGEEIKISEEIKITGNNNNTNKQSHLFTSVSSDVSLEMGTLEVRLPARLVVAHMSAPPLAVQRRHRLPVLHTQPWDGSEG